MAKRQYKESQLYQDDHPFQTMYDKSFNQIKQAKSQERHHVITPQKNYIYQSPQQQNLTSRRFGQYSDANNSNVFHRSYDQSAKSSIWSGQPLQYSNINGNSLGRRNRCSDKFVKYPYPKNLITNYQKDFHNKMALSNIDAFNVEKEHKIINPHKMDMSTTNKTSYQPYQVQNMPKEQRQQHKNQAPCLQKSTYQSQYPHWMNGKMDIYHEKQPQYPVYSLPFKGNSLYQQSFTDQQMKELRRQQQQLKQLGNTQSSFKLTHYQPHQFEFETVNQTNYKPFQVQNRPQTSKPKVEPVRTQTFPGHFETYNKKEFVQHNYKIPEVDFIPYP